MSRLGTALGRVRHDEGGFSLVEGIVAALLLVIGAMSVFQLFDASARNTYRAEESQVLNDRLQAELEAIKQLPYDEIAMSAPATDVADESDPRSSVSGTNYAYGEGVSGPMVVDAQAGAVNPEPTPFTAGDVSGKIYRFVVWRDDPTCGNYCPGTQDMKRIIVAAKIDEAPISFERSAQQVQTEVTDPETTPVDNPGPPDDQPEDGLTAEFWLTDTPCSQPARVAPTADHPTHNTSGLCDDGIGGQPDLMYTEAPAVGETEPTPPLIDYASDVNPLGQPRSDGLMMPWSNADSCLLQPVFSLLNIRKALEGLLAPILQVNLPGDLDGILQLVTGDTNKHHRVHTWLSPTVKNSGGVLSGTGQLELWSKTVNNAIHEGEICVSVFIRQTVKIPVLGLLGIPLGNIDLRADIPLINTAQGLNLTYFSHHDPQWPTTWQEIEMDLQFIGVDATGLPIPIVLTPGSQIGMTIMVKKSGTTGGQALEFMYDHPNFDSRLQLDTNQIVAF